MYKWVNRKELNKKNKIIEKQIKKYINVRKLEHKVGRGWKGN